MIWKDKDHDLMWEYLFKKLKEKIGCSNSKLRLNCQYFNGKYLIASFKYVDDKSTKYFPFIEIHPREFEKHQKYRLIFKVKVYDIEISARTKEFFLKIQRRIEELSKMNNFEYKLSNVLINELDNGLAKDDKHSNHAGSFKKEINADYISIDETISMIESIVLDFYKMLNK